MAPHSAADIAEVIKNIEDIGLDMQWQPTKSGFKGPPKSLTHASESLGIWVGSVVIFGIFNSCYYADVDGHWSRILGHCVLDNIFQLLDAGKVRPGKEGGGAH